MGLIEGKVALVTGAGTGIGREASILLAREGATVVLTGRRIEPLEDVAAEIKKQGGKAISRSLDIGSRGAILEVVGWVNANVGAIDILVPAAPARC
jgi:NADP-dependent 3-hydroxy acid dehydrogenase YdfG